jgi:hypothetical protein
MRQDCSSKTNQRVFLEKRPVTPLRSDIKIVCKKFLYNKTYLLVKTIIGKEEKRKLGKAFLKRGKEHHGTTVSAA